MILSSLILLVPAVVLIAIGAWVISNNILHYLEFLDSVGKTARLCEDGVTLCVCAGNLACFPVSDVQQSYVGYFIRGFIFAVAGGVLMLLFSKRQYLKERHILW
jgi:uncharacterized membrane protein